MPGESGKTKASAKERLSHEVHELITVFLMLAPFFLAFDVYRMCLEGELGEAYLGLGMALLSALVLAKVVLIGELAHLGVRSRTRPLVVVTIHKAAVFTAFYAVFHLLEKGLHGLIHHESFLKAVRAEAIGHGAGMAIRLACVFFAFIPFFALMESRHVIGEERFHRLFLGRTSEPASHGGGEGLRLQPRPEARR